MFERAHRHALQRVCYYIASLACSVSIMKPIPHPFDLYCIADAKPGHRNQLKGLAERIATHAECRIHWLDASQQHTTIWSILFTKKWSEVNPQGRGVCIGAGHLTHNLLLKVGRSYAMPTVVIMKPSLPLSWFDFAIVPEHDAVPPTDRILCTQGAMNTITPTPTHQAETGRGLMLIGGDSEHFLWDTELVLNQIQKLCMAYPQTQWLLTDSRRTPQQTRAALSSLLPQQVNFISHRQTDANWIETELNRCQQVWVTPDSVSMVYEAITANRPVGLFSLTAQKTSRIQNGLSELINRKRLKTINTMHLELPTQEPLWEADRAALWLLDQLQIHFRGVV